MKLLSFKTALAALVLAGAALAASPASAVSYYDDMGRAFYYNNQGQKVFYDTGYNAPEFDAQYERDRIAARAAAAGGVVKEEREYRYYYPTSTVAPQKSEVITTTYTAAPQPVCREYQETVQQNGQLRYQSRTECMQSDGTWQ
jgi:hypothetical protein